VTTAEQIAALVKETGSDNPRDAVRIKARELITLYRSCFGEPSMPLDVEALASLRGIRKSEEVPTHSRDAELVPGVDGRPLMRVNPDRPGTRRRFSMAHEVSHTFFPEYELKVQCRPDPRYRDPQNPDDLLEMLCDVGAAELLFPVPWFTDAALAVESPSELLTLADDYRASREATIRRFAETHSRSLVAVFFAWKLKPTQDRRIGCTDQANLFGTNPEEDARACWKLRIEYAIPSHAFAEAGHFLPKDKSIEVAGPFAAAAFGSCGDGDCPVDLGSAGGTYRVWAFPLYTPPEDRGPGGELAAAAILEPLEVNRRKKKAIAPGPSLFD
jgi:IrrE N-terminal-like domain